MSDQNQGASIEAELREASVTWGHFSDEPIRNLMRRAADELARRTQAAQGDDTPSAPAGLSQATVAGELPPLPGVVGTGRADTEVTIRKGDLSAMLENYARTAILADRQRVGVAAPSDDGLPRWIDDQKGKDPLMDDMIAYIIDLRAQLEGVTCDAGLCALSLEQKTATLAQADAHIEELEAQLAAKGQGEGIGNIELPMPPCGRRVTYVPLRGKKGVIECTVWGPTDMVLPAHRRIIADVPMFEHAPAPASAQPAELTTAEFLAKRLGRVAKLAGVAMPDGTYEQIAEVAGTILGEIARRLEAGAQPSQRGSDAQDEPVAELIKAADAVVERWHSRDWKQPHTAEFISRLSAAVGAMKFAAPLAVQAQEAEPHNELPECWCHACNKGKFTAEGWPVIGSRMILCPTCGNKRCPHASDHAMECTGSNEPGQSGSVYSGQASAQDSAEGEKA